MEGRISRFLFFSIVQILCIRVWRRSITLCWQGVVLLVKEGTVTIAGIEQQGLFVTARGKDNTKIWRILSITMNMINAVLRQWPGLAYDVWCPWTVTTSGVSQVVYFELRQLQARRRAGEASASTLEAASAMGDDADMFAAAATLDSEVSLEALLGPVRGACGPP